MENSWLLIAVLAIAVLLLARRGYEARQRSPKRYQYTKKSIVSPSELAFFHRLEGVVRDKYCIFPQVHLSSLLDHQVKGQNWKAALAVIQRKSVDYVLVDKTTLQPVYAIELDDPSHDAPARQKRDELVESLLSKAGLPLIRFRNTHEMDDEAMISRFADAAARYAQKPE